MVETTYNIYLTRISTYILEAFYDEVIFLTKYKEFHHEVASLYLKLYKSFSQL